MFSNTSPISPLEEIIAYESLWANQKASFKNIANLFASNPGFRASDLVQLRSNNELFTDIKNLIINSKKRFRTNVLINGTLDFPVKLKDAKDPIELLYYTGKLDYLNTKCVAIVGTRNPSRKGLEITREITKRLVEDNVTIVSGLAKGIDTQAHLSALSSNGRTIGVIGTPIDITYPLENSKLQNEIASKHLLLSQVPFYRYSKQDFKINRFFFLERNKTMSALSDATLIIEAGETSGSLTQAAAAIYQNRKLLIWDDCFNNNAISWPNKYLEKGAIRVKNYEDIYNALL
jgi:DNA processing protein